jgi:hypothetical protein
VLELKSNRASRKPQDGRQAVLAVRVAAAPSEACPAPAQGAALTVASQGDGSERRSAKSPTVEDLLQAIRDLECPADFRGLNFQPFIINDLSGPATSHYEMTRDGFNGGDCKSGKSSPAAGLDGFGERLGC